MVHKQVSIYNTVLLPHQHSMAWKKKSLTTLEELEEEKGSIFRLLYICKFSREMLLSASLLSIL